MTLLASAFLLGLLGGLHCLAMCGAFVVATRHAARPDAGGPSGARSDAAAAVRLALLNAGRGLTYAVIGAVAGGVGSAVGYVTGLRTAQVALFLLANLTLMAIGVQALRGTAGIPSLERFGGRLGRALPTVPLLGRLVAGPRSSALRPLLAGVVWGFVPCGLIYTALALALFSGSAVAGALVMAALWAGTLPALGAAGWVLGRVNGCIGPRKLQVVVGLVLLAFSALGLYRLFLAPHSAALEALCRLP